MRIFLIIFLIIQFHFIIDAQPLSKFDFFIGYGFYEGFNAGGEYYFRAGKQSVDFSLGYDKFIAKNQENISFCFGYNYTIFRRCAMDSSHYKWHINNQAVLWQLVDDYYVWRAISIIPSLNRRFILYRSLRASIDIGPAINIVLYNKRKTFKEVGWPYHVMPNFRIKVLF